LLSDDLWGNMAEPAGATSPNALSCESDSDSALGSERLCSILERLRAHQFVVRACDARERIAKLKRLKAAIIRHREQLVDAMYREFRKPRMEVELSEIQLVFTELDYAIHQLPQWMRKKKVGTPLHLLGTRSEIWPEPKGVVLILAAWNYPFALLFAPLVAAVAAGNCVVLRGSERVPYTCEIAERILTDTFSRDEVALVQGNVETARELVRLPFDHIFFTGTSEVGREVLSAAASNLTPVTLELGGKSPVIVDESADISIATERIVWGKFFNGGQTCVVPDYLLVQQSRVEELTTAMREKIGQFYGKNNDELRASTDLCRIIDKKNFNRLVGSLQDALRRGAKIEIGATWDERELYISPTVLSNVSPESLLMKEEIFGPVLPILSFSAVEQAIDFVNARPKPLALYVFAGNQTTAQRILERTSSGGAAINNVAMHLLNPNLPFGGIGCSGMGKYHGRYGFEVFSQERAIMKQGTFNPARWFYPPYARLYQGPIGWLRSKLRTLRDK